MDLEAHKKSLNALLAVSGQQFRIPPYQRPYAWTAEQIDDLWSDLLEHAEHGHFLGSIVTSYEDEDRPLVIDGQQRLTTLMLLLAVLRDECTARGLTKPAQQLDQRLTADNLEEGDAYWKLRTGSANWHVFRDFVLRDSQDPQRLHDPRSLPPEVRARNRALLDNIERLRAHLRDQLGARTPEQVEAFLVTFGRNILKNVELVHIAVRDLADAFLLFETLNDRGLQLSAADLLKSHLLGEIARTRNEEDVDEAAGQWDAMLDDLGTGVDVPRFLRHYLLGMFPRLKKDDVFGTFKDLVKQRGAVKVLADLRVAARHYGEFEHPSQVAHEPARRALEDLQTLRASTCYIALLPARRVLSESDFVGFARLAEVLTFRYSSVVGLGSNDLERRYHEAAKALQAEPPDLDGAKRILIDLMPPGDQFRASFERLSMGTQYLVRYALARIDEATHPHGELELKSPSSVHIEHVMPKKLNDAWRARLGYAVEHHEELVNRWGNLTLFYSALNIPASNKDFDEKKQYYAESQVGITRRLCDEPTWGPEQIENRQRWLASVADEVWAIPPRPATRATPGSTGALARFQARLGELWDIVEPMAAETSIAEIQSIAADLPHYLDGHDHHAQKARAIAADLQDALSRWAELDAEERRVLRAATVYFLAPDDAIPDDRADGLADDGRVVDAALRSIGVDG